MTLVLKGVRPSGEARPYLEFMAARGVKRTRAFSILKCDLAPPTFQIGSKRYVDLAVGQAWFAALADGQFSLTAADLRGSA